MVNRGTNQQSSAPYNRRIVLDVIRRHGSLSRKEIVDRVALSPQTVANITSDLESVGLVVARRLKVQKSRGQPPIVFELNPNGGTSIGITIEPGRVRAALVNLVGQVIRKQDVEVDTHDRRGTLAVMVAVVNDLAGVAAATGPRARRRRRAARTVRRQQHELRRTDRARGLDRPVGARRAASDQRLPRDLQRRQRGRRARRIPVRHRQKPQQFFLHALRRRPRRHAGREPLGLQRREQQRD